MARKKSEIKSTVYVIHLTLREGKDDPLIDLLQDAPPRKIAETVRETMRKGLRETEHITTVWSNLSEILEN